MTIAKWALFRQWISSFVEQNYTFCDLIRFLFIYFINSLTFCSGIFHFPRKNWSVCCWGKNDQKNVLDHWSSYMVLFTRPRPKPLDSVGGRVGYVEDCDTIELHVCYWYKYVPVALNATLIKAKKLHYFFTLYKSQLPKSSNLLCIVWIDVDRNLFLILWQTFGWPKDSFKFYPNHFLKYLMQNLLQIP